MRRVFFVASLALVVACGGAPPGGDDGGAGGGATGGGSQGGGAGGAGGGSTVPDTTPPEVVASVPSDNLTGVSNSTVLQVLFTEPMRQGSISLALVPAAALGSPSWNAEGTLATWAPSAPLAMGTAYQATVTAADLAGNGLVMPFVFRFTTTAQPDTAAPVIESSSPAANATGVATNARLRVTFNEAMATGSIAVVTSPAIDQGAGTWTDGDRTVTWSTPAASWDAGTLYRVALSGKDLAGNALVDAGLSFTTAALADTTPPTIAASTPVNGAVGVAATTRLSLTFSEAMATGSVVVATTPSSVLGTPTWLNANRTVTWSTPSANWAAATTYAVRVTGRDVAANPLAADAGLSFTTAQAADTTPPTVVSTSPVRLATAVARTAPLVITFSEPMSTLATQAAVSFGVATPACAWAWTATDTVATCTPALGWPALGTVTVTISVSARDKANVPMAAPYSLSFSTQ